MSKMKEDVSRGIRVLLRPLLYFFGVVVCMLAAWGLSLYVEFEHQAGHWYYMQKVQEVGDWIESQATKDADALLAQSNCLRLFAPTPGQVQSFQVDLPDTKSSKILAADCFLRSAQSAKALTQGALSPQHYLWIAKTVQHAGTPEVNDPLLSPEAKKALTYLWTQAGWMEEEAVKTLNNELFFATLWNEVLYRQPKLLSILPPPPPSFVEGIDVAQAPEKAPARYADVALNWRYTLASYDATKTPNSTRFGTSGHLMGQMQSVDQAKAIFSKWSAQKTSSDATNGQNSVVAPIGESDERSRPVRPTARP